MVKDIAALIDALSKFLWPALAFALIALLYRPLRQVIESRSFSVKVGDLQVSVQEASEQLRQQVEDLQHRVAALLGSREPVAPGVAAEMLRGPQVVPAQASRTSSVLWVDDNPPNNAFLVANLTGQGFTVELVRSTQEALDALAKNEYGIVISDMGRAEGGKYVRDAGMQLLRSMRERGLLTPVVFYTSRRSAESWRTQIEAVHAAVTSSPVELLARMAAGAPRGW